MSVVTISVIKADVGGYVGHSAVHPELLGEAERRVREGVGDGLLIDGAVNACGDDVNLVMTHRRGVDDTTMHRGFTIEVHDLIEHRRIFFDCPEDLYDLLVFVGTPSRYVIKHVFRREHMEEPVASTSTSRLSLIAGRCVGKDDPIMIVRCQSGLPAVGEGLEPFARRHLVAGWMRGSHNGPLMPCAITDSHPARFDGLPRVVGMGFQLADGRLIGPRDMLGDISFDRARQQTLELADHLRRMGPFEPGRLPMEDMEYTTMPAAAERVAERWEPIEEPAPAPA